MNKLVRFKRVTLGESGFADIAFIWLFAGMNSEMSFQFVGIRTCVRAVLTLIRSFSCMTSHVAFQFGKLNASIIALSTSMRLFVGMSITYMSNQFTWDKNGRCYRRIASEGCRNLPEVVNAASQYLQP